MIDMNDIRLKRVIMRHMANLAVDDGFSMFLCGAPTCNSALASASEDEMAVSSMVHHYESVKKGHR